MADSRREIPGETPGGDRPGGCGWSPGSPEEEQKPHRALEEGWGLRPKSCCCGLPGSSVHGILQARILGWVAISSSRGIFLTQASNPHLLRWWCILYR